MCDACWTEDEQSYSEAVKAEMLESVARASCAENKGERMYTTRDVVEGAIMVGICVLAAFTPVIYFWM